MPVPCRKAWKAWKKGQGVWLKEKTKSYATPPEGVIFKMPFKRHAEECSATSKTLLNWTYPKGGATGDPRLEHSLGTNCISLSASGPLSQSQPQIRWKWDIILEAGRLGKRAGRLQASEP